MNKIKLLLVLLCLYFRVTASAQTKNVGVIKYEGRMNMIDTVNASIIMDYSLSFNDVEATFFYTDATSRLNIDGSFTPLTGNKNKIAQVYQNFNSKTIIATNASIGTSYLVKDAMDLIPWKLSKDTKKIQNIECFSAQAEYRGRVWTAWYAPSIPISSGPWKLYGLPGMILEAEDIKKLIKFECVAIIIPPLINMVIEIPKARNTKTNEQPISTKEYAVLTEKDIESAEKMSYTLDGQNYYPVRDIEIFDFEAKKKYMKRIQQKLSNIPKK